MRSGWVIAGLRSRIVSAAALKYTRFNDEPGSAHNLVVGLVPQGARVLEFGCATGYMSEVLGTRNGCTVTGIEISPEAAEIARERCDRVIIGDAEELDYEELFGKERFDAILFVDVLEHLKEPAVVLGRVRPFLSRKGAVIASIPNIAHGSVRLALLAGEFRYRDLGLLDDTHLRFFTREGVRDLFEASGFVVTSWLHHRVDIDRTEVGIPAIPMSQPLQEWLSQDPDTSVYQFVVRAVASTAANQLIALRSELATASAQLRESVNELAHLRATHTAQVETHVKELEDLRGVVGQLQARASEADELRETIDQQGQLLEGLRERIKAMQEQKREHRDVLLEAHRQLLQRDQEIRRLADEHRNELQVHKAEIGRLRHHAIELQGTLQDLQATKAWRAVGTFWKARASVSRTLHLSR
jgi:2-polyprenyl-3-methyl-5-hydroxy-6-metoxy-1,4-benzoquinol methylase